MNRHLWLDKLEAAPLDSVSDLLDGHADVRPFTRVDAPDAATMLVGHLPADDPAREALGAGLLEWLEGERVSTAPEELHKRQDYIRQVCEALQIISLLDLKYAVQKMRENYDDWLSWTSQLDLGSARDARGCFLRMLANTQSPDSNLAHLWFSLCGGAGTTFPRTYLQIGLLGLRRLPPQGYGGPAWLRVIAVWALAQNPSEKEFLSELLPLLDVKTYSSLRIAM